MRRWLHAWRVLTGLELRRFLRTPGVYRYLLVPGWMILPVTLLVATALLTARGFEVHVALPRALPDEVALGAALVEQGLVPLVVDDPLAAYNDGDARGAFLGWSRGDGVYGPGAEADPLYELEAVALDLRTRDAMAAAVRDAGTAMLEGIVVASGGSATDLEAAPVLLDVESEAEGGPITFEASSFAAYLVWLLGLVGYLLLVGGPVADRNDGVLESVLTTRAPATAYLAARVASVTIVQAISGIVLYGSVYLLLSSRVEMLPPVAAPIAVMAAASVLNSGYLALGIVSPSLKTASNAAGLFWLASSLGMVIAGGLGLPAWLPVIGVASAGSAIEWVLSVCGSAVGLAAIVAGTARLLHARPQLKIGGDR